MTTIQTEQTERTEQLQWFCGQIEANRLSLYRLAKSLLRQEEDAQDAVQDAILSAYEKLGSLRSREKFRPWIMRILANACYDILRTRRDTAGLDDAEAIPAPVSRELGELLCLREAIDRLPADYRAVIVLFYYEGLSIREISHTLRITQGAVKTRLNRAREKLRHAIFDREDGNGQPG